MTAEAQQVMSLIEDVKGTTFNNASPYTNFLNSSQMYDTKRSGSAQGWGIETRGGSSLGGRQPFTGDIYRRTAQYTPLINHRMAVNQTYSSNKAKRIMGKMPKNL